jgi:protein-S-isoprenylcysteine O-methyltransferase Ste14
LRGKLLFNGSMLKLAILFLSWLGYFLVHSLLASLPVKQWVARHWPACMPAYRLLFNAIAIALVLVPVGLTHYFQGEYLWRWRGLAWWLGNGLALAAVLGFLWSLRYYAGGEFSGWRQWRHRIHTVEDQERFTISPLHRFVRHPWYFFALVIIWTRDMEPALLVTAAAVSLYFIIGSRLEERKLLVYHGDAYRRYREKVPGLVPLPWRYLGHEEARALLRQTDQASR